MDAGYWLIEGDARDNSRTSVDKGYAMCWSRNVSARIEKGVLSSKQDPVF
jgi:hypothetical protein